MSSALAIAAVTAVLRDLLANGLIAADLAASGVDDAGVSALPPDRIPTTSADEPNRINLFLYHATHNAAWRNAAMPAFNSSGDRLSNPPLALDLLYLLSAYGTSELHADMLLGVGMQLLHETPVVARKVIRRALNPSASSGGSPSPTLQALAAAELPEQIETIKVCPQQLNTEELSKLWTAFQAHYRPSAAYQVSVMLIERKRPTRVALPVREPKLVVQPLAQPAIHAVEPQMLVFAAGAQFVVRGADLRADDTIVRIGGQAATPTADGNDERLVVPLPADIRAGINSVQIVHRVALGTPPPRELFTSNVAALVVRPVIQRQAADTTQYDIQVTGVTGSGNQPRAATVTFKIAPPVGNQQRVTLLLNEIGGQARAFSFAAPGRDQPTTPATADSIGVPISGVAAGDYLVRVAIDGAQSPLDAAADQTFAAPRITIP